MLRRARRTGVRFSTVSRLPQKTAGWRAKLASVAPWIFILGALSLIVAAARPRKELSQGRSQVDAIAIAMTLDVSGSMEALDLTPKNEKYKTRLDVVKEMFAKFVEARPDDLIGLVTFGGYASSLSPLTADHEALRHVLKGVNVPNIEFDEKGRPIDPDEQMTAVGDGLATALARLKDAAVKSKIVILLSDGVSNAGVVEPDQAAQAALKMGIKVYTIGVGTNSQRTPFKTKDAFGRTAVAYANMSFDESQLKSIASTTKGRYFSVRDAEGLEAALEEIDTLEKTTIEQTVYHRYTEFFPPFLLWGVFLLFSAATLQMLSSRRVV
jgi:Ca-activated chloride channel family protein